MKLQLPDRFLVFLWVHLARERMSESSPDSQFYPRNTNDKCVDRRNLLLVLPIEDRARVRKSRCCAEGPPQSRLHDEFQESSYQPIRFLPYTSASFRPITLRLSGD